MRKWNYIFGALLILTLGGLFYLVFDSGKEHLKEMVIKVAEGAYFEGQKDALENDIRIKFIEETKCYIWLKTPWDDGTKFMNPSLQLCDDSINKL